MIGLLRRLETTITGAHWHLLYATIVAERYYWISYSITTKATDPVDGDLAVQVISDDDRAPVCH